MVLLCERESPEPRTRPNRSPKTPCCRASSPRRREPPVPVGPTPPRDTPRWRFRTACRPTCARWRARHAPRRVRRMLLFWKSLGKRPPVVVPRAGELHDGRGLILAPVVDPLRRANRNRLRGVENIDSVKAGTAVGNVRRPVQERETGLCRVFRIGRLGVVVALVVAAGRAFDDAGESEACGTAGRPRLVFATLGKLLKRTCVNVEHARLNGAWQSAAQSPRGPAHCEVDVPVILGSIPSVRMFSKRTIAPTR